MEKQNLNEKIQISYKKLKASAYFDKTSAILREKLVEFETNNDFEEKLHEIGDKLINSSSMEWIEYTNRIIKSIKVYSFPKKIDEVEDESCKSKYCKVIVNQENSDSKISINKCENIQNKIGLDIVGEILGVLWVLEIGSKLDRDFEKISYGNRLLDNDGKGEKWSPYLYKPYFNEYQSWRDKGLQIAEECYKAKKDCLIIMLDIKKFYYSVNFNKEIFESFIEKIDKNYEILDRLNNFVYDVIERYSNILNENKKTGNIFLPIGFSPSPILANWYLNNFDKNIMDRANPSYYGRYVDDMIIVDKVEKNTALHDLLSNKTILTKDILKNYFIDEKKPIFTKTTVNMKKGYKFINNILQKYKKIKLRKNKNSNNDKYILRFTDDLHKNANLEIQYDKFKIFYLKAGGTKALIDKFKGAIRENSSEFRLLPEGNNLFLENYNDIYKLEQCESINKLRGITGIEIDKYELSKFIGKNLTVANLINDKVERKFYEDIDKIFEPKVIIENYLTWESILTLCIVNKEFDKFKEITIKILKAINKIEEDNNRNKIEKVINIKNTLKDYLISCIYRSTALVWGSEINDKLKDILILKHKPVNERREGFCSTRMISKTSMIVLIDIFIDLNNKIKLDKSPNTLYLNELDSSLKYVKNHILSKEKKEEIFFISKSKLDESYKYYPYLITMQDITKSLFFNNALLGNVYKEEMEDDKIKISSSSMVEKLYYSINYMKDCYSDKSENLIKTIQYPCPNGSCEPRPNKNEDKNYNIIRIGNLKKDEIRVAIATAKVEENNFIGVLMDTPNRSLKRYNELAEIIKQAVNNKADILILPENYVPFEWLYLLEREAKKNDLAIITGVEHIKVQDNVYNLIASIFPYRYGDYKFVYTNLRTKVFYSPEEKRQIKGYRYNYIEGKEFNLFVWNNIWIPVYCCFEIASIKDRSYFSSLADLFTIVEWNKDINYFSNIIESLSRDLHCYCVQVNSSNYGDSCLISPSKSYKQTILRTKGGTNSSILIDKIDVKKLRLFQIKEYELQKDDKDFKPTPPNFDNNAAFLKDKNQLFEELLRNRRC